MRPILLLCTLILASSFPATAQENPAARTMTKMFLDRCVIPLLNENPILTIGLDKLPQDHAMIGIPQSEGRVWSAKDTWVTLGSFKNPSGEFAGCAVVWNSWAANRNNQDRARMDHIGVVKWFNFWADSQIARGDFIPIQTCGTPEKSYSRSMESITDRSLPIRVFINTRPDIDFVFLVAAETQAGTPVGPCDPAQ